MLPDKDELLCIFTDLTLKHDTALSGGFRRGSGRHPPSPLVLHDNSSTGWFDWSMPAWLRLLVTKHSLRFRAERFWFTLCSLKYQCFASCIATVTRECFSINSKRRSLNLIKLCITSEHGRQQVIAESAYTVESSSHLAYIKVLSLWWVASRQMASYWVGKREIFRGWKSGGGAGNNRIGTFSDSVVKLGGWRGSNIEIDSINFTRRRIATIDKFV